MYMQQKKVIALTLLLAVMLPAFSAVAKSKFNFTITGIKNDSLINATERINLTKQTDKAQTRRFLQKTYRSGFQEIKLALQPFGYFKAQINGTLKFQGGQAYANYAVAKGPPIHITKLTLNLTGDGQDNPWLIKSMQHFQLHKGDILDVPKYQKAKAILISQARRHGYIFAKYVSDNVKIDLINYQVSMLLTLDTGPRYYFGFTTLGKSALKPSFLRKFLNYKKGYPFNPDKLTRLQNIYSDTGYFRSITITPKIPNEANRKHKKSVPVNIDFLMRPKRFYQIGLGYGTLTGVRMQGTSNWRWVNSNGDKFKLSGLWSKLYYQLSAQYLIPSNKPKNSFYTLNASMFIINPQNYSKAYVAQFGPGYLWQRGKWKIETILYYLHEKWQLSPSDTFKYSHLVMPQVTLIRLSQKNVTAVENGTRIKFTLSGAVKHLYSSLSYLQPQFEFKWIKTVGENNRLIFLTVDGASIGSQLDKMPLSQRFFAGGPNNLLGYDYQGIGPGNYLTVANVAYQRKIYKSVYGEVFYNIGNAFDNFYNYAENLQKSAGIAAVWRTPHR